MTSAPPGASNHPVYQDEESSRPRSSGGHTEAPGAQGAGALAKGDDRPGDPWVWGSGTPARSKVHSLRPVSGTRTCKAGPVVSGRAGSSQTRGPDPCGDHWSEIRTHDKARGKQTQRYGSPTSDPRGPGPQAGHTHLHVLRWGAPNHGSDGSRRPPCLESQGRTHGPGPLGLKVRLTPPCQHRFKLTPFLKGLSPNTTVTF